MQDYRISAYEGSENYIFISYAHKDTEVIIPILEKMQNHGYRIWYDEGIAPGSEWPENIAQHLNDCAVTLAFVSPNSMASDNCRREITFALSKKKPFLAIILEPTQMSPGMELQLSAQQCVMKYSYRTEAKFMEKVYSCPDLACCKVPDPEPEPVLTVAAPAAENTAAVLPSPVQTKPQKAPVPAKAPATAKKQSGSILKKPWIWCAAAAAVILLILLFSGGGTGGEKIQLTPELTVSNSETSISLYDETVTADMVSKINALPMLETLSLNGCQVTENALSYLGPEGGLKYLYIRDCTGITDYAFLNQLSQLTVLTLENSGVTDGFLPMLELPEISQLEITKNPGFTDPSKLSHMRSLRYATLSNNGLTTLEGIPTEDLRELDFSNNQVTDLSPLAYCTSLTYVYGANNKVSSLDPLAALTNLATIDFTACPISKIDVPFQSLRMSSVYLNGCGISDISGLENMTKLRVAWLGGNQIADLSWIAKSAETLSSLSLYGNPVAQDHLSFLAQCTALQLLCVNDIPLTDLSFTAKMGGLQTIYAEGCGLTDISALSNCPNLYDIFLHNNRISDISPLSGLSHSTYTTMDLGYNLIQDISDLPNLKYSMLSLIGNPELDIRTLPAVSGTMLVIDHSDSIPASALANSPFNYHYIFACPDDRKVALEDMLGYGTHFLYTENELVALFAENDISYEFILNP